MISFILDIKNCDSKNKNQIFFWFTDEENEESGKPDLHQCGNCREMFFNFAKYITHKLQKVCWNADHTTPPTSQPSATATNDDGAEDDEEGSQHWPNAADDNNGLSSPGEKEDEDDVDMTVSIFFSYFHFLKFFTIFRFCTNF